MPINYDISGNGTILLAKAFGNVTAEEFIEYEIEHSIDERIISPLSELLVIEKGALDTITKNEITRILDGRHKLENTPMPHRCAIVVSHNDLKGWDITKLYRGMVKLHDPRIIIMFGDEEIARTWLAIVH